MEDDGLHEADKMKFCTQVASYLIYMCVQGLQRNANGPSGSQSQYFESRSVEYVLHSPHDSMLLLL